VRAFPVSTRARRGSALITVVMLAAFMALLTASMLKYTLTERRGNERNRLNLRTKTAAENICLYAAEQITTKLYRLRSASPIAFIGGTNQIALPPVNVLQAANSQYSSGNAMEAFAGLTGATGLVYIDPATRPDDPNAGLQVNTASVPIIARATGWHPSLGSVIAYARQDLAVDFVPLFQFAAFYNMDMEVWPGANLTLAGPVHVNGELSARCQTGFSATIAFLERVSASRGYYADSNRQGSWTNNAGTTDSSAGGTGPVTFRHSTTGTATDIKNSSNVWRDHKYGQSTESATTQNNFKVFATNTYGINLRTSVHGVTELQLPAVSGYAEVDNPATVGVDERNNGRQIIERPNSADSGGLKETKISRKAGLYIIVNPDDETRNGYLPDGTAVSMRARSYRCWLNTVNSDLSHTLYEVILPGQPSYGPLNANINNLPNAYRTNTAVGHNQVLRTIQGGAPDAAGTGYAFAAGLAMTSFDDAYFFDLRRAKNNTGFASATSGGSFRSSNPYTPRPIVKIDFDLTRFRMCVERTLSGTSGTVTASDTAATVYDVSPPVAGNWASSIFNPSGAAAAKNLGLGGTFSTLPTSTTRTAPDPYRIYFAPANPANPAIATTPDMFAVGGSDLVSTTAPKPWFDGITVYIHSVDAEERGDGTDADTDPDRIDSAVRLWNGRGPVISLDGTAYPSKTGFTLATNDAAYIIGHFNADGTINSTTSSTGNGGYSARYPDSSDERLCAVMADAITIVSQPYFTSSTSPYTQNSGWSDSLSAHRNSSSGWSSSWQTSQPSGSNGSEGISTSKQPGAMPNLGNATAGPGFSRDTKFTPNTTEISTCLLVGIVPTNHNPSGLTAGPPSAAANGQGSGGLHNFPRLLEVWGTSGLWIRGSMVAMFESRVAMEPWSLRVYSAPSRTWGLHENLRSPSHDLPLEPILLGARRLGYREITAAEYAAMKTTIEALPH